MKSLESPRVPINFSELYCEKLFKKNLLVLVSRDGPQWLGQRQNFLKMCMPVDF